MTFTLSCVLYEDRIVICNLYSEGGLTVIWDLPAWLHFPQVQKGFNIIILSSLTSFISHAWLWHILNNCMHDIVNLEWDFLLHTSSFEHNINIIINKSSLSWTEFLIYLSIALRVHSRQLFKLVSYSWLFMLSTVQNIMQCFLIFLKISSVHS